MIARFFIDRPIFAAVLSILVTLGGAVAWFALPVTQYPAIAPPTVEVSAVYPGANAQVLTDTVASPIEQQVNGTEDMLYMSSQCGNDGRYTLTVTFGAGTDLNLAQVLVQNRVALAQPVLPELVRRRGVTVKKKSTTTLLIINLFSPEKTRDDLYLSNYATIQLRDELSRLPGVGDISFLGQRDYSMRVWLNPQKMAARNLSPSDVVRALDQQNVQVAAGQIGQPPAPPEQVFQYTMSTRGRLTDETEFGNIVLKVGEDGGVTRLQDVARVELGALEYDQVCTLNGQPSVALSVYQLPGSNALQVAKSVKQKMRELRQRFPEDLDYAIVYDTTPFVDESLREVLVALRDAVILVSIVVLVFLQGWRAAVIPLVAVPVAIVGTFAAMAAADFSLNTLTLFGLVLAIGIVVDDAIVVVEAVEHHIEAGLSPRDAAIKAMDQVSGPVVAVGLVLTAVFIPCLFISGVVGQFFRQFAVTIAISTLISAFNSLTLSPALAVLLLRPRAQGRPAPLPRLAFALAGGMLAWYFAGWLHAATAQWWQPRPAWVDQGFPAIAAAVGAIAGWLVGRVLNFLVGIVFAAFNRVFGWLTSGYVGVVRVLLWVAPLVLIGYGGLLAWTWHMFQTAPAGFIPSQDKGYLLVDVRLPDSTSLHRSAETMAAIEEILEEEPGVRHSLAIAGLSLVTNARSPNFGTAYAMLDDFQDRPGETLSAEPIARSLQAKLSAAVTDGVVQVFGAPPIEGVGATGGFRLVLEDRGKLGMDTLAQVSRHILADMETNPDLSDPHSTLRGETTWLFLDIDRDAAKLRHVSLAELFSTLQVNFGSLYVNDFNRFDRTWQVNVQAESGFRMTPDDMKRMHVRSDLGEMVPLGAVASIRETSGPQLLVRYNLYPSAIISANAGAGASSGQALQAMQAIANQHLLPSMRAEWTELALLQQGTGATALYAFVLAVVLVFLVLAAQYESWALPLAVILVVPMCLLCSIAGVRWAGLDVNIFTQIGFVVLVGLACKNAILIVEFARARHDAGATRWQATLEACRLRLRPIVMTSLAFIIGVVPLMYGHGAGAEMRRTLGTAVFYGMLGVTLFGIFLTPVFYFVIQAVVDFLARFRRPAEE